MGQEPRETRSDRMQPPAQNAARKSVRLDPAVEGEPARNGELVNAPSSPHVFAADLMRVPEAAGQVDSNRALRTDTQPIRARDTIDVSEPSPQVPQPAREISMRVSTAEAPRVDIKLIDRAGSVRVAVRTPDTDLARNLQSGLSDLVHRLERKGFETESWSPGEGPAVAMPRNISADSNDSASQNGARDPRDGTQQDGGARQDNGRNRPKWVAELEQRLGAPEAE